MKTSYMRECHGLTQTLFKAHVICEKQKSQMVTSVNTDRTHTKTQFDAHALVVVKKILGRVLLKNFATRSVRAGAHYLTQQNYTTKLAAHCNRVLTMTSSKSMIV